MLIMHYMVYAGMRDHDGASSPPLSHNPNFPGAPSLWPLIGLGGTREALTMRGVSPPAWLEQSPRRIPKLVTTLKGVGSAGSADGRDSQGFFCSFSTFSHFFPIFFLMQNVSVFFSIWELKITPFYTKKRYFL